MHPILQKQEAKKRLSNWPRVSERPDTVPADLGLTLEMPEEPSEVKVIVSFFQMKKPGLSKVKQAGEMSAINKSQYML